MSWKGYNVKEKDQWFSTRGEKAVKLTTNEAQRT